MFKRAMRFEVAYAASIADFEFRISDFEFRIFHQHRQKTERAGGCANLKTKSSKPAREIGRHSEFRIPTSEFATECIPGS